MYLRTKIGSLNNTTYMHLGIRVYARQKILNYCLCIRAVVPPIVTPHRHRRSAYRVSEHNVLLLLENLPLN